MRQFMGFVAYIITGGTDSTGRLISQKDNRYLYANACVRGRRRAALRTGLVVRSIRPPSPTPSTTRSCGEARRTPRDWFDPDDVPARRRALSRGRARERCFRLAKRRFFFEHAQGAGAAPLHSRTTRATSTRAVGRVWKAIRNSCVTWSSPSTASSNRTAPRTTTTGSPCGRATATTCRRRQLSLPCTTQPADSMAVAGPRTG